MWVQVLLFLFLEQRPELGSPVYKGGVLTIKVLAYSRCFIGQLFNSVRLNVADRK